ncbi:MAG: hypothetical protein EHM93_13675 [Bacteroidales bacterium]|nr:MAG: hypothetical protein EHM93_13675 [Bacteroidales bacterium]
MARNIVKGNLKKEIFYKGYFKAPIADLMNFQYGKDLCPICKESKTKFFLYPDREIKKCCLDCLLRMEFYFTHDTEKGFVTYENLPIHIAEEININKYVSSESISKLLITPNYSNIQGDNWKLHCDDFMNFIGIWEPLDFTNNSPDMNGKKLFLEMTDENYNHLWEECELEDNERDKCWIDVQYYAFQCTKCGKLKGYWNCS